MNMMTNDVDHETIYVLDYDNIMIVMCHCCVVCNDNDCGDDGEDVV